MKHLISVCNFPLHTKLTLMMKQQNKLMPCPSAALGLFIALILYDHRRAIAWSKLISSKRQWVRGKKTPFQMAACYQRQGTWTESVVQTSV